MAKCNCHSPHCKSCGKPRKDSGDELTPTGRIYTPDGDSYCDKACEKAALEKAAQSIW